MATFVIPILSPSSRFSVDYDVRGTLFRFVFHFNSRESRWYMDILDSNTSAEISTGVKMVADFPLLGRFVGELRPEGIITAFDTSGSGTDPLNISDLGARTQILIHEFIQEFP